MKNHNPRTNSSLSAIASILCLAALLPGGALAEPQDDKWKFSADIYGWLPDVGGTTSFPGSGGDSGVSVDASDILDSLDGVFMGGFTMQKGRWGAFIDAIYLDLKNSDSDTRSVTFSEFDIPANANLSAELELSGWAVTTAATYSLIQKPSYRLDLLGGVRYLELDTKLNWDFSGNVGQIPLQSRSGSEKASQSIWDAIIGVRGQAEIGESHWFIPYYLDIGTGDSDFTWQAMAGVGYAFRSIDLVAAYRYLDWNFGASKGMEDLNFSGPLVGIRFRW